MSDPDVLAKMRAENMQPKIRERRIKQRNDKYYGDLFYNAECKKRGMDYFMRNKQKQYDRIKARKHITADRDREYIKLWQRHKRQTDPQYNIGNRLRSRLWHALRGRAKKAKKTMELIGCTIPELIAHLESQFTEGMSMEGIMSGKIHLDHKRPCSSFDLTDPEQQKICFHFSNIQPLWEFDNLSKGATIPLANPPQIA